MQDLIKRRFTLESSNGDLLEAVILKKNKDYYITSMPCYVDLAVDVTKLLHVDKIKEISDLTNAILADGVDFSYKKMPHKQRMKERGMHLKLIKYTGVNTWTILNFLIIIKKKEGLLMSTNPTKSYKEMG